MRARGPDTKWHLGTLWIGMAGLTLGLACGDDDAPSSPGPAQDTISFRGNGTDLLPRNAFQPVDSWITSAATFEWIDDGTGTGFAGADTVTIRVTPAAGEDGSVASSVSVLGPGPVLWTSPGGVVPGVVIGTSTVQFSGADVRQVGAQQTQLTLSGLLTIPTSSQGLRPPPTSSQE